MKLDYFTYLSMTRQKDNKDTYIKFLMEVMEYTKKSAESYAKHFYNDDGTLREE